MASSFTLVLIDVMSGRVEAGSTMHELFAQVLDQKDLSRAGDLFSLAGGDIEAGLTAVLRKIREITSAPDYISNTNNQSVVEICITRVTSCIRETGSIEAHSAALISVLESCLRHNLRPTSRGDDPPHAKITSDILSCLFLNYSKKSVMQRALPVAVRFLHAGNKDLCRNVSSYLSLAAIENGEILAQHAQPVIDSIVAGNHSLVRILPQLYMENKQVVSQHVSAIIGQLPNCDPVEASSILQVAALVAKDSPQLLEKQVGALTDYLGTAATSSTVLAAFIDMAASNPAPFVGHVTKLKQTAEQQPVTLGAVVSVVAAIGRINEVHASDSLRYLVSVLPVADNQTQAAILREVKSLAELHPVLLPDILPDIIKLAPTAPVSARILIQQIKDMATLKSSYHPHPNPHHRSAPLYHHPAVPPPPERRSTSCQTEGAVTVITVGNLRRQDTQEQNQQQQQQPVTMTILATPPAGLNSVPLPLATSAALPDYKHASTSTREIHDPAPATALGGGATPTPYGSCVTVVSMMSRSGAGSPPPPPTTASGPALPAPLGQSTQGSLRQISRLADPSTAVLPDRPPITVAPVGSIHSISSFSRPSIGAPPDERSVIASVTHGAAWPLTPVSPLAALSAVQSPAPSSYMGQPHAIPFRDAVQQFCEKHLSVIKAYIDNASARVSIPIKASLDESKHKKNCRIHFICFGQDQHCLYSQNFFSIKTKLPRLWIHLMFLAIQARSVRAVSQQDPSVGNLKVIWDSLKVDSGNSFVRLVTSSFPSAKDQDLLLAELRSNRYFDVFEFAAAPRHWACFLCNHPERVTGLLQDGAPSIEGRLKEKKGRWKIFKRWKTRYFTLSGATITYSKKDSRKETLPVTQIQSVKALRRGMRDRPKAFEIFTNDQTYVFKVQDGKNAEQWVQCLQIAVARSQKHDKVSDFDIQTWDLGDKLATAGGHTDTSHMTRGGPKDMQETQTKL